MLSLFVVLTLSGVLRKELISERCTLLSELYACLAILISFVQDGVVLLATESEAHTKLVQRQPFSDWMAVKLPDQEQVKRAIVSLNHFEHRVCRSVFSSSAQGAPRQNYAPR